MWVVPLLREVAVDPIAARSSFPPPGLLARVLGLR